MKITDLANAYLADSKARGTLAKPTLKSYRHRLKCLCVFIGAEADLGELTPEKIKSHMLAVQAGTTQHGVRNSARSVHSHWSTVKSFCAWLVEFGHLPEPSPMPIGKFKLPRLPVPIRHRCSPMVVQALLAATQELPEKEAARARCVVHILCTTAIRRAELLNLRVKDISVSEGTLHVVFGKGGKSRTLYLPCSALEAVGAWLKVRASDAPHDFLLTSRGEVRRKMGEMGLYRLLSDLACRAGIEDGRDCLPHAMRRGTASRLLHAGYDIRAVQEVLGHSSLSITEMYVHSGGERLKALRELSSLSQGTAPPPPKADPAPIALPSAVAETAAASEVVLPSPASIVPQEPNLAHDVRSTARKASCAPRVPIWAQGKLLAEVRRAQKGAGA
jgi:integrase/recombinase XerC